MIMPFANSLADAVDDAEPVRMKWGHNSKKPFALCAAAALLLLI